MRLLLLLAMILFMFACRDAVVYEVEYAGMLVCDTINIKYNTVTCDTVYTLRCVDEYGNEYIIYR